MNCRYCGTRLIPGAMFCGECGRSVAASGNDTIAITADPEFVLAAREPEAASEPEPAAEPLTESEPAPVTAVEPDAEPAHEPPLLDEPEPSPFLGERFVLQFSTGES